MKRLAGEDGITSFSISDASCDGTWPLLSPLYNCICLRCHYSPSHQFVYLHVHIDHYIIVQLHHSRRSTDK